MAQDRFPAPPQTPVGLAEDHELVQALTDARILADGRGDHTGWRELAGRLDRILEAIGVEGWDPITAPATEGQDDQPAVGQDTADHAAASLLALLDRPDEDQLALANRALRALETGLG